jgi:hypothetical protein
LNLKLGLHLSFLSLTEVEEVHDKSIFEMYLTYFFLIQARDCSLLFMKGDRLTLGKFLTFASKFVNNSFVHLSNASLFGNSRKILSSNCNYWIDGGSLTFASIGLCIIGYDLKNLSNKDRKNLLFSLVNNKVVIGTPVKSCDYESNFKYAVWAYTVLDPLECKKQEKSLLEVFVMSYSSSSI